MTAHDSIIVNRALQQKQRSKVHLLRPKEGNDELYVTDFSEIICFQGKAMNYHIIDLHDESGVPAGTKVVLDIEF